MKFAAIITYLDDKEKVAAIRPQHRQYLAGLRERGQLAASGPFTDDSGALIVYEASSQPEAESFLKNDPFFKNGIFERYDLRPWKVVIANAELFTSLA